MEPVTVSVDVKRPRQEAFDYVDVLRNHEAWMDHLFKNWRFEGPPRGAGAKAIATVDAPSSRERVDIEVVESEAPSRIVEEVVTAHGKRRTRGTYTLTDRPSGGTRISFQLEWLLTPKSERILPPLSRAFMKRANGKSLRKLRALLESD